MVEASGLKVGFGRWKNPLRCNSAALITHDTVKTFALKESIVWEPGGLMPGDRVLSWPNSVISSRRSRQRVATGNGLQRKFPDEILDLQKGSHAVINVDQLYVDRQLYHDPAPLPDCINATPDNNQLHFSLLFSH